MHSALRGGHPSRVSARQSREFIRPGIWHVRRTFRRDMSAVADPRTSELAGYHCAVSDFKRRLIEATLHQVRGNRTHAARALGLQRTYLLRLMRELGVDVPPPPRRGGQAKAM